MVVKFSVNLFFLILFFMLAVLVQSEPEHKERDTDTSNQTTLIKVPYVTLRGKTGNSDVSKYYSGSRGNLNAGSCTVSFTPIWGLNEISGSAPFYIPDESIKLTSIEEVPLDAFYDEIRTFSPEHNGNIVIYIHGYNIDFEKSCKRSAILQRALGLKDRLMLFSWPADGNMLKYTWDESDLMWSVSSIARFIDKVVKQAGYGKVDIVAHSLGARGVIQALVRMSYTKPENFLNELVLIAPDIDTEIFRQELPLLKQSVNRITVYVSENDKALRLSHEVHGYPRLGEGGENLAVFDDVETIDISAMTNRRISGHLYHLFNPEVIRDLTELLHNGTVPAQRPWLKEDSLNGKPYWRLTAEE